MFGITAAIRIGQQGRIALIEHVADKPALLPDVLEFTASQETNAQDVFTLKYKAYVTEGSGTEPNFAEHWDAGLDVFLDWPNIPEATQLEIVETALDLAKDDPAIYAQTFGENEAPDDAPVLREAVIGDFLVSQWNPKDKPVSPLGRIALAVAHVAIDYVSLRPGSLGIDGAGQKIVTSFAKSLSVSLHARLSAPTLGPSKDFAENMFFVFAQAGFSAFREHSAEVISDDDLARLVSNSIEPVLIEIDAQDDSLAFRLRLRRLLGTVLGPSASVAMRTVAENPAAFFGSRFDASGTAGALTSALLMDAVRSASAADTFGIFEVLKPEGAMSLLAAGLTLAAERPNLFLKEDPDDAGLAPLKTDLFVTFARKLSATATKLKAHEDVDGEALVAELAAEALLVAGRNVRAVIAPGDDEWQALGADLAGATLKELAAALAAPGDRGAALRQVFSPAQLKEFGRIVLVRVAASPGMTSADSPAVKAVISGVAAAMAADENLLLSGDDWLTIVEVVAGELAKHPKAVVGKDDRAQAVFRALAQAVSADANNLLQSDNWTELARSLAREVSRNPSVFTGDNEELSRLVGAVTTAMAADANLLLSGDDWTVILKVAIDEAARNPGRLFGLDQGNSREALAADMLKIVFQTIPDFTGNAVEPLDFIANPALLTEAAVTLLRHSARSPDKAEKYAPLVRRAVGETTHFVADNRGELGGNEWLQLTRILTAAVFAEEHDALLAELAAGAVDDGDFDRLLFEAELERLRSTLVVPGAGQLQGEPT